MKFFNMVIDESLDDITGVDYVSLVDVPAHLSTFQPFSKKEKEAQRQKYTVIDEEQGLVLGVLLSEGYPIYRWDPDIGDYYAIFPKEEIAKIQRKFVQLNFFHNLNLDHDQAKHVEGQYMLEQWIVDEAMGKTVPPMLADQNIRPGSWIGLYKITDPEILEACKNGTYTGFSVEGYFSLEPREIKQKYNKLSPLAQYVLKREITQITAE